MKKHIQTHLHHIYRLTKQTLDLLKQEIFAVVAVATLCLVVVLIYSSQTGIQTGVPSGKSGSPAATSTPSTGGSSPWSSWLPYFTDSTLATNLPGPALLNENSLIATTDLGNALLEDNDTIYFSSAIKGYNRAGIETWQSEDGIQNYGSYIQVLTDNRVTIAGITNGNHTLYVKGYRNITLNGTGFGFRTLTVIKKVVGVTNGTLAVTLKAGAQIYFISTSNPDTDIPVTAETDASLIPAKILMMPNKITVTLNNKGIAIFKPVVIVTDPAGKQISNTAGLLSWSSSDPEIAQVGTTGIVTATKIGGTAITAQVTGTNLSTTVYLTVKALELSPLIDVTPQTANVSTANLNTEPTPTEKSVSPLVNFFNNLFHRD